MNEMTCTICGQTKTLDQFKKHNTTSGRVSRCKVCVNRLGVEKYRRDNPGATPQVRVSELERAQGKADSNKQYRISHGEQLQAYYKHWRKENRENKITQTNQWYQDNRERALETVRLYRKNNHEEILQAAKKYAKVRWSHRLNRYGLTVEQYNSIAAAQDNLCAICGQLPGKRGLVVDHNHKLEKFRGLLCSKCNSGIGLLRDDPEILLKAIAYLVTHDPDNYPSVASASSLA